MKVTDLQQTEKIRVDMEGAKDILKQVPVGKKDGAPNFCFRVFTVEPGEYTPYHTHEVEHVNYFISGKGALVNEEGVEHPVTTGSFSLVLPHEKHQFRNKSDSEPLVFICAVPTQYE